MATSIAIVEDDDDARTGLEQAVVAAGARVVGCAATRAAALTLLRCGAEVWLVDLQLPDGSGIDVIAALRALAPVPKVIVISALGDVASVLAAVEAGADGYLLKDADGPALDQAIASVQDGGAPISPAVAAHLLRRVRDESPAPPAPRLTARELEVLGGLAHGMTLKEIAAMHRISPHTVGDHVKSIYRKLDVGSRGEAVLEAVRTRLIRVD